MTDKIQIALIICDKAFVIQTAVCIQSIIQNKNDSTNLVVYIVAEEINEAQRGLFMRFEKTPGVVINVIDSETSPAAKLFDPKNVTFCTATPAALKKFHLAEILPGLDKVLYLDGDIIVQKDLSELWETDIRDCYAAVVLDSGNFSQGPANQCSKLFTNYFNSGMMLLNLSAMRNDSCSEKLVQAYSDLDDDMKKVVDQNAFNTVFDNHVKLLPMKYNCLYTLFNHMLDYYDTDTLLSHIRNTYKNDYSSLEEILEDAVIVHFASQWKPWKSEKYPCHDQWFQYYNKLEEQGFIKDNEPVNIPQKGNEKTLVSIITAVHNTGKFISECLESIVNQSYPYFELLCIDGGSSDKSISIIEAYQKKDNRIRLIKENLSSTGAARNRGLAIAKGKYVVFVDSDDYIVQDMLQILVQEAEEKDSDIVCFPCRRFSYYEDKFLDGLISLNMGQLPKQNPFSPAEMGDKLLLFSGNYAFSRFYSLDFLQNCQLRFQEIPCFDDLFFTWIGLEKAVRISRVAEPLSVHRIRPFSKNNEQWKYITEFLDVLEQIFRQLESDKCGEEIIRSFYLASVSLISVLLQNISRTESRYQLLDGLKQDRFQSLMQFIREPGKLSDQYFINPIETIRGALDFKDRTKRTFDRSVTPMTETQTSGEPMVSIVMPVYQAEQYLEKTLDSVLSQSMRDFELICVDDGSEDQSLQTLLDRAAVDDRVRIYTKPHIAESAPPRDAGVDKALGKYIYFIDSDDLMQPGALERLVNLAEERHLDVLYFDGEAFYDEDCTAEELRFRPNYHRRYNYPAVTNGKDLFVQFIRNGEFIVVVWMGFYKRSFLKEKQISFPAEIIHEDNLFTYKVLMNAERAGYIHESFTLRRIHPNSIMTSGVGFRNAYGYFVTAEGIQRFLHTEGLSLDGETVYQSACFSSQVVRSAKNAWQQCSAYEKGKALALGDELIWFKSIISEPGELALQKIKSDEMKNAIAKQRTQLQERSADLQKEVDAGRKRLADQEVQYQKKLSDKDEYYKTELEKRDAQFLVALNERDAQFLMALNEKDAALHRTVEELSAERIKQQQTASDLNEKCSELEHSKADTENKTSALMRKDSELSAVYQSASWRVGNFLIKPFHAIKVILHKLKN